MAHDPCTPAGSNMTAITFLCAAAVHSQVLDFSNNKLSGTLPDVWGGLTKATKISLGLNLLTGGPLMLTTLQCYLPV